ncbi:MAG: amino acid adenylation domain-containing protein [Ruminococcaceae bacterium]|nr:amino acid adenylation domain-containing protein [Oscillospiraceae bacterium]
MMRKNILQYLEQTALRTPDKCAFSDGRDSMSFSALLAASRAIGTALLQQGLSGEPVAVFMNKHPSTMAAFFGVIYAGCHYVCLDAAMPDERIRAILDNLSARAVIYDARNRKRAEAFSLSCALSYDEAVSAETDEVALQAVRERQIDTDPIYVVFTSGSTGVPKGVVACHRSVIDYTESLCEALGFDESTVFGNQTPLYFDAPLKEIMPTLKLGATTYFIPKMLFSFPVRLIEYLDEHHINTICWVVSALVQISSLGALENHAPKHIHTVAFGSELFPRAQYELWRAALPDARFFNLYGPTEATGMSCYWYADRTLGENEPIPVGRPFENTAIHLLRDDGTEAAWGEEGEICIRGTCVTMGYYNNEEKTDEAFVINPLRRAYRERIYRTGDMGRYNEQGELVFLCRRDSQIKHMGHRIELGEIEAAAARADGVRRACCVYDTENKRIGLFYVGDCEQAALMQTLASYLPRYMLPAVCERLSVMPLTDNGKLDRRGLRERLCRS